MKELKRGFNSSIVRVSKSISIPPTSLVYLSASIFIYIACSSWIGSPSFSVVHSLVAICIEGEEGTSLLFIVSWRQLQIVCLSVVSQNILAVIQLNLCICVDTHLFVFISI